MSSRRSTLRILAAALPLALGLALLPDAALAQGGPVTLEATSGVSSDVLSVLVDRQMPQIRVTSPADSSTLAGGAVTVTGTLSDRAYGDETTPASPVYGEVSWRLEAPFGVALAEGTVPAVEGRFTIPNVSLATGENILIVSAVDAGGFVGEQGILLISDPNAPAVALVSPLDGSAVLAASVAVDLNFAEATTLVAVNGVPDGRVLGPGLVAGALTVALEPGPNVVTLALEGPSGSFQHSFTLFRVESLEPPRITSVQDGGATNDATFTVTGTVPLGTPYLEVNGVRALIEGAAFTATVPLHEGENAITAVAYPQAATGQIHVTLDTRPPGIHQLIPDDGTLTLDGEVLIGAVLDEAARVEVTGPAASVSGNTRPQLLGGFPASLVIHLAELAPLLLADGANALVLTATDRAGNQTVVSFQVTKSGAALALSSPVDGSAIPALRVTPVVEALADVTIDALYVGALRVPSFEGATLSTGFVTLPAIPLVPGANELRIAYHRAGGAPEVVRFAYQSTATAAMTVTGQVRNGATGAAVGGALVSVTVNGITVIAVTGADGAYSVRTEAGNATVVAMAEGYSTESAAGSGSAGDTVVADLDLDDTGIPGLVNQVAVVVPPPGTVTDFEKLTVVGTVLNPLSSVTVNGIPAEVVGHRFTARHVPLAMGANTISVSATALGALPATASVAVQRANEPVLAVKIFSPPEGATIPGGGLVVRGFVSAKDALVNLHGLGDAIPGEGTFDLTEVVLSPGPSATIAVEARTTDGQQTATDGVAVSVASETLALKLAATPASGTAPLDTTLSLTFGVALTLERIDFDVDGDGQLDVVGASDFDIPATFPEPRFHAPRAFVTTPEGVELSAAVRVQTYLPEATLREFAAGNPVDLAEDPNGSLLVLDGAAGRISRYDANGGLLDSFGSLGSGAEQLSNPQALAVAGDGRIFVADTGNDRVQVFASDGSHERSIGSSGSGLGQLEAPRGVAIDGNALFVADTGNDRMQEFDLAGVFGSWRSLAAPRGLAGIPGYGAVVASPVQGLLSSTSDRIGDIQALFESPADAQVSSPIEVASNREGIAVIDAGGQRIVLFWPGFVFRRVLAGFSQPPLAVLHSTRREVETLYVADGSRVREIALPVPSPLPAAQGLKAALAAGDVEAALALTHPLQRKLFRGIYGDIEPDLSIDAAAMEGFEVDLLRETYAIVRILTTSQVDGAPVSREYPMHLIRGEDGQWQIFDY